MYHPRFSGSHYEMGFKFGQLMSKNHIHLSEIIKLTREKREFGQKCIAICNEVYPEAIEEMEGIADGIGFPLIDFASWIFCIYCYEYQHGCTCLAFKDADHIIFGRNSDFYVEIKKACESALYMPDKGYWFIGNSTAMVQMEDGYNEHGLAIGLNYIFPKKIKPGLNAGMLLRYMLEKCRSVKEALEVLSKLPISSTQKFAMIDKSGDMAVVECNYERISIIEPSKSGN